MNLVTNDTRFKVDEAFYFLSMMKQTYKNKSDVFYFNLHAFLTAFRSITFYMQRQYKKCNGFPEWYCQNQIKLSSDSDLRFLLKIRNEIIHKKPVSTTTMLEIYSRGGIINDDSEEEILKKIDEINKYEPEINIANRFFETNKEPEIVEFCENQLNKLTELVDECELKFKI